MEQFAYLFAIIIGLTLGLTGGGGSILTVPVLVYILGIDPVTATAYSLFIVGITSFIGAGTYMKKKQVSYLTAVIFAVPAFAAVFTTRKFIIPAIPGEIFSIGSFVLTKDIFIMVLFAVLMFGSSISMIRNKRKETEGHEIKFNYPMIFIEGILVGVLTGMVGAGGGFLIIPALVLLANLPMKMAIGTSLLIISVNSLIGFLGDISAELIVNWNFLLLFSGIAIAGIVLGSYLSNFIEGRKLKPAFGWFVLVMSIFILGKELFTSFN